MDRSEEEDVRERGDIDNDEDAPVRSHDTRGADIAATMHLGNRRSL